MFLFIGFISYPLYLIHGNLLVSGITKLQKYTVIPEFLLPIFPILLLILIAYVITKKIERFPITLLLFSKIIGMKNRNVINIPNIKYSIIGKVCSVLL